MKAIWNDTVIAESDKTIMIEGNHYFPPDSVQQDLVKKSETHTVCPWKGQASYYDVVIGGQTNKDAAWYYPEPKEGSIDIAGEDFKDYVAFWNGVEVKE